MVYILWFKNKVCISKPLVKNMLKNQKKIILVTGGAGFIGSHLCDYFIDQGHSVICVDSFFSGKKENIEHLLKNRNFRLIRHNIIFPLKSKFPKLDEIYNLACPASPLQYQFDPVLTLRTSVDGTINMLNLARKYGARFLQASTSEVYGDPLEHPQKEEYFGNVNPLGKRSCYDEGKRAAETLVKDYRQMYGVDGRIVRLFNTYGPRMMFNDGRVISNFILQALLGEDITVFGDGSQSRSFMYIDDLLPALAKIMSLSPEAMGQQPVNLGNPDERSIKDLAQDIKKLTQSPSKIIYIDYHQIPERLGDPQRRCPDISRAQKLLDWKPTTNFDQGLIQTIEDFKKRLVNRTKVAVFAPSYYPLAGPAEKALRESSDRLLAYDFDLFVAKNDKRLANQEKLGRINVYRLGSGSKWDKYLLPILAVRKALSLHRRRHYQLAWGIMASYGALAAAWFSLFSRRAFLVSLYEGQIKDSESVKRKLLRPFYKLIFRTAHKLQVVADLTESQLAWLEDDNRLSALDLEKGWDYISKKTREEFQQLEILSSRL